MRIIQTATGKQVEGKLLVNNDGSAYITFDNLSIIDAAAIFGRPIETREISYYMDGELVRTIRGYTGLVEASSHGYNGKTRVCIAKPSWFANDEEDEDE